MSTNQNKHLASDTFTDNIKFSGADLAKSEHKDHRLLYVSPILTEDLHISGVPKVSITLSSSSKAANLSVWLVSLPWDEDAKKITENIITRGWADPKNHKSITDEEDLEPGKFYTVNFDLQPDDQIIKAGQQIGFMIFSSDKEFTLHPKAGTELTIKLDKTSLILPIVGGSASYKNATN